MTFRRNIAHRPKAFLAIGAGVLVALASCVLADEPTPSAGHAAVTDVVTAFGEASAESMPLSFSLGDVDLPPGGHLQGIQMCFDRDRQRYVVFLSHDSATKGYLLVVEFAAELSAEGRVVHVQMFPSDGKSPPLRHAGGFQLAGDALAVGLEDNQRKTRSEVQFWDVSDPRKPARLTHLTIPRAGEPEDKTSGAVGLIQRKDDWLAAAGNWDSRAIDFYTSNGKPLADADCRFELRTRWSIAGADKTTWKPDRFFAEYQALNLIAQTDGQVFLAGFATTSLGKDVVDLFSVDLEGPPETVLRKVARKPVKFRSGNHFRNAGGLSIDNGRLLFLASPRNPGPQARLSISR